MGLSTNMHPRFGSGGAILASRNGINRLAASSRFFVFLVVVDFGELGLADLGAVFGQRLLGHMDKRLGVVLRLDLGFALLVFLGVRFGVLDHLLDVALGQAAGRLDADLLLLAGAFVLGRNIDDAVGVDVESDLDLRHAARRRRNTDEIE